MMTCFCVHQYFILMDSRITSLWHSFHSNKMEDMCHNTVQISLPASTDFQRHFLFYICQSRIFMDEWKIMRGYMKASHQFCLEYSGYCAIAKSSSTTLLEPKFTKWREKGIYKEDTYLQSHSSPVADFFTACQSPELLTHKQGIVLYAFINVLSYQLYTKLRRIKKKNNFKIP